MREVTDHNQNNIEDSLDALRCQRAHRNNICNLYINMYVEISLFVLIIH